MRIKLIHIAVFIMVIVVLIFGNKSLAITSKNVTVYFNANGGEVSTSRLNLKYNGAYGELPVPTKEGYEFKGWYTLITGGREITKTSIVSKLYPHTLYAQWGEISTSFTATEFKKVMKEELIENNISETEAETVVELLEDSDENILEVNSTKIAETIENAGVQEFETAVLVACEINGITINKETGMSSNSEINKLLKIIKILEAFEIKDGFLKDSIKIDQKAIKASIKINSANIMKEPVQFNKLLKQVLTYKENVLALVTTEKGKKLVEDMSRYVKIDQKMFLEAIEIDVGGLLKSLNIKNLDFDELFKNEEISGIFGKSQEVIKEMVKNEEIVDAYLKNLDKQRQGTINLYDMVELMNNFENYLAGGHNANSTFYSIADFVSISHNSSASPSDEQRIAEAITITKAQLYESSADSLGTEIYLIRLAPTMMIGSCGVEEDILVAMGTYNEYLYNVEKAIREYNIPKGANIVVVGASLGGMEAQQIAATLKNEYNFKYVIGIESGYIMQNEMSPNTQVILTTLKADLVTVLPLYAIFEDSVATNPYKILMPESETNTQKYKTVAGAHISGCIDVDTWGKYDVLGNKISNGAHIELLEKTSYYAAPKNQEQYLKLVDSKEKEISFNNVIKAWNEYADNRKEITIEEFIEKVKLSGIQLNTKNPYTYINVKPNGERTELLILNTNKEYRYVFTEKNLIDINLNYINSYKYSIYDLNFSGSVTYGDYTIMKNYIRVIKKFTKTQALYYFDFNNNGIITNLDTIKLINNID